MSASVSTIFSSNHGIVAKDPPKTRGFYDKSKEGATARAIYLRVFIGGTFATIISIFAVFSIYWGSLWKIPAHNLPGWVVDFDDGLIGQYVVQALSSHSSSSRVTWTVVPASQVPGGLVGVANLVLEEQTWVAITINEGSSARLLNSMATPNASYDGNDAMTVFAVEARNENAFRNLIRPSVQASLDAISKVGAIQLAQQMAGQPNLASILTTSPQTITAPISYRIQNLAPFDIPVATAVTFVGLIYQLILSFFVVMISLGAREAAGFGKNLHTRSLIILRLITSFSGYFFISLFYSSLSIAFQLPTTRKFGHGGFLIFWMLNYASMLSVGLALESLITLLNAKNIPFFMMFWIISNVSVCSYPIEVMPKIFRYGYVMPFYNVSRAMRTIIFKTKNRVGLSFSVLVIWIAISCITLPLFQWFVRKKAAAPAATPGAIVHQSDTTEKSSA